MIQCPLGVPFSVPPPDRRADDHCRKPESAFSHERRTFSSNGSLFPGQAGRFLRVPAGVAADHDADPDAVDHRAPIRGRPSASSQCMPRGNGRLRFRIPRHAEDVRPGRRRLALRGRLEALALQPALLRLPARRDAVDRRARPSHRRLDRPQSTRRGRRVGAVHGFVADRELDRLCPADRGHAASERRMDLEPLRPGGVAGTPHRISYPGQPLSQERGRPDLRRRVLRGKTGGPMARPGRQDPDRGSPGTDPRRWRAFRAQPAVSRHRHPGSRGCRQHPVGEPSRGTGGRAWI